MKRSEFEKTLQGGIFDQLPELGEYLLAAWDNGYLEGCGEGYNEGFQVAQAAERGIIKIQSKINEYDQDPTAPAPCTSNPAGVPGLPEGYEDHKFWGKVPILKA